MWNKPDSEDLLPAFMQEAMGFFKATAICFGIPVVAACSLLYHNGVSFAFIVSYSVYVLNKVFFELNSFYLIHLSAALLFRFVLHKKRFPIRAACAVTVIIDLLAIMLIYPPRSILTPQLLKNILLFVAVWPSLMVFFILRIHRLYVSGGIVIVVFFCFLCGKYILNM